MFLAYERIRKVGRVPIKKVGCALALRNLQDIGSITHGSPCSPGVPRILWKHVRFHHSQNKKSYWSRIDDKFGCAQESARKVHSIPMLLGLSKLKCDLCRSHNSNGFSVMSASAGMTYHAQAARRRLSLLCCYRGPTFPAISKLARAVSLACVRSHLTPRILVLIIGLASWAHNRWAESEELYPSAPLNSQVNNSHAIFTSSIWSFLEGLILVIRALYLMALFTPAIAMAPLASLFEGRYREIWLQLVQRFLEKAGAAFIKWGQWAATHPNLFPRDLCKELAKLHTKAPAHKFSYTQKTIEKSFGRRIDEIFDDFEEEPVASGSIAQVHKATLTSRYPGQKVKPMIVAVKVRHPGVSEVIQRDFVIINLVAKVSSYLPALRWLRLEESVQLFAIFMLSQVDLSREAAHLNRFLYNFRRWKDVSFPKPLYPLVHPAVLVETYEQGESVAHYVDQPEGNYCINRSLAHTGTHTLLKMLLILGGTHFSQAHLVFYFGYIALPVVGWPPIKSFRRNLAPQPKVAAAPSCNPPAPAADPGEKKINTMFVKVNVDGIPIGRKINLKAYDSYEKLSVALDEMFRGSINGGAARISKRSPDLAGLGVVGTLHKTIVPMTAIGALLLDKSGRRPLLMVSAGGMSIGCFLVGLSFYIQVMEQMHISQPS